VAEGNPLFVEEMLRAGLVGGLVTTSSRWQELGRPGLPPKIQSVITSRLARLSANARALAEVAATSGRSFTFDILRHVSSDGEDAIVAALDELWQRRIVRVQGQARYDFSHDKIREATYAGISPVRVPLLHRRVARALEQLHAANLDPVSGDIAAHYAAAGLPEQAIPYYRRAIEVAQRMCAHAEALTYLTRAQALLAHLPETPERLRQELNLQLDLGISVFTLKGVSALETLKTYERAYQLAERVGDRQQRLVVLQALCGVTLTRGLVRLAYEVAEREVTLAEVSENPSMVADAHFDLGMTLFYQGQWGASREHIERRVALPDYQWYSSARLEGVPDGDALCRRHLAIVLWHLGYADRALARMNEAVALAQAQADPFNLTAAFIWSARLHRLRGEAPLVHTRASQAVALGRQQGFAFWLAFGTVLDGWALAQGTEVAAGVAETQDGLAMLRKVGAQLHEPECLSLLAEAHGWAGDLAQGLRCLDEALAIVEATGARCTEAEICRLQGELLRRQGARPDDVDTCFRQALAVAQAQGALALELRAALSLCRLWRSSEARALLAEVYGRFTEGWETRNLREAREMLAGV
jgi:predicted ATPase